MNRELLVKLIKKNIDELIMLTDGFLEMTSYPDAIIGLAKNKTDDIWGYINELGRLNIDDEPLDSAQGPEKVNDDSPEHIEANDNSLEDDDEFDDFEEDVVVDEFDDVQTGRDLSLPTTDPTAPQLHDSTVQQLNDSTSPKPQTLAEKLSSTGPSRNEALGKESNGDLNAAVGLGKVDDVRQAISIGDRFRFQRELFGGNGEEMNKTLAYINKLASYEEVEEFLNNKYAWEEDNQTAMDFFYMIKRKF